MNSKKLNEILRAYKSGDYAKLQEVKSMVSEEEYKRALELFNQYSDKSEDEILGELANLKESVPNHEEMIERIKPLLNEEQLGKLNKVLEYLNNQE